MSPLTLTDHIVRNLDLMTSEIDHETVMMSLERSSYFGLDAVGSRIWQLLAQPLAVNELCGHLQAEYDVDTATCLRDVVKFLEQLLAEDLIRMAEK